jgi:hypothetical protein
MSHVYFFSFFWFLYCPLLSIVLDAPDILNLDYALAGHYLAEIDTSVVDWSDNTFEKVFHEFEKNECEYPFIEAFVHLGGRAVDPLLDLLKKTDNNSQNWTISKTLKNSNSLSKE